MGIEVAVFIIIVFLESLASGAMSEEMVTVLVPSWKSPVWISSNVYGPIQCTKNSDESYAVCASDSNTAIKYNLQPFSFAAKGPNQGYFMQSCDLYEAASHARSRAVCVKGRSGTNGTVYFHRVSDMINITNVSIGITSDYAHAIVDTANQVAYISNDWDTPAVIYKIIDIGSSTPIVVGNVTKFGSGSAPAAMLIVDGFLYVHFDTYVSGLARIDISTFTWNHTVTFTNEENYGWYDNLANDDNFIYDLTQNGILVRCTYKNNNFSRFDRLNTGFSSTVSLAISPDSSFLLLTAAFSGIIVVNTSTFSVVSRELLPGYLSASGRPIMFSKINTKNLHQVCAFGRNVEHLYIYNFSSAPFGKVYPTIYPLSSSPINTSSGVKGTLQCTKNSDESYAVCASMSNTVVKYNLQPFSFAAKGPNQGNYMFSCDLYETSSQSASRAVCIKSGTTGVVYFHNVSDMTVTTNVTIGRTGNYPHVIVDTPNQVAYISNYYSPPAIYKITNIGSSNPIIAGNLTSFGSGDITPAAMLIIGEFLYVHFAAYPASSLARINVSTFTWNQTVTFLYGEYYGYDDNLANDDNFVYDLTQEGIVVRCTYKNNNFTRFDILKTVLTRTYSLAISPNQRTLFVVSQDSSLIMMVDAASFAVFGNTVVVPSALGRLIVLNSSQHVFAFSGTLDFVYAFLYSDMDRDKNHNNTSSSSVTLPQAIIADSDTVSFLQATPSLTLIESATPDAKVEIETKTATLRNRREKNLKTRTLSREDENKNVFIQKISQPVASALVASDATQAIAVVSIAVLGSISSSPVLGFNVGRQQAMTNFAKKSLEGDCRGLLPATTVNEFEQHISNPLGLGDSPTQMSIGGSEKLMSYYVGAVVGDFILTFGLVLLSQGIGMAVMKYFENKKNSNSNFGKMVRDRMGNTKNNNNNNNNKESTFEMMRRVFATSYVSLTLFFCLSFLLTPILSSSLIVLVAAMNDPKLKDHQVGLGLKILCIILAVIFCAVAVYFVVWSVFVRKQRKEKYRNLKQDNKKSQNEEKNIGAYLFKAEGEWCYPNPTSIQQPNIVDLMNRSKKNNNNSNNQFVLWYRNFLIAEPTFESYRDTIWFCCVEIISAILLAFPPFFAQFASSAKGSCLVQGIMLLLILLVYTILLIWKNPFKLRILRIMNPALALQQLVTVLMSLIIAASRNSNSDDRESPSWLWKVIIIPLGFQGAMSFLMIGASLFPFITFVKKLQGRMSRNERSNDGRPKNNNLSADRVRSPQRTTSRRHDDANEVELLPRRSSARQRTSSEHDHRERHLHHNDNRGRKSRNQHPRSSDPVEVSSRVNREKSSSSTIRDHREGHRQTNSRGTERDGSSSFAIRRHNNHYDDNIPRDNDNNDRHHHHHRRHEMERTFNSPEREERRSSHSHKKSNDKSTTDARRR